MICPNCGANLPDTAKFCGNCGSPLGNGVLYKEIERPTSGQSPVPEAMHEPDSSGQSTTEPKPIAEPASAPAPKAAPEVEATQQYAFAPQPPYAPEPSTEEEPSRKGGLNKGKKFVAIAFAACILIGVGLAIVLNLAFGGSEGDDEKPNFSTPAGEHPVTFYMSIEGYGKGSTRIPVKITGTDYEGGKVNKTIYLAYSGVDTSLAAGDYEAEVVGSPISSNGTLYSYDNYNSKIEFSIDTDLGDGEEYHIEESKYFRLDPIPADEVTDEQIADALEWARKDEGLDSSIDLDEMERIARTHRDTASFVEDDSVSA